MDCNKPCGTICRKYINIEWCNIHCSLATNNNLYGMLFISSAIIYLLAKFKALFDPSRLIKTAEALVAGILLVKRQESEE